MTRSHWIGRCNESAGTGINVMGEIARHPVRRF